ncbi:hypothetical protein SAZ_26800 [Streptomyces noursei ZPM]|uniref:DUF397 domain-containing protein n=2 Tax=Streptomyces noursei TaxID=1971 RepID=A0A401R6D8_STRNR|nr:DUF397 domain-containing protein [Streptomyces noursei]AKA05635.1 hypothetical protein SAZ_26800 [Streptomyces noursei ZPM]EXU85979.1 hypothetical protein P354_04765 [Streptomyces noursei PD-1]UWS74058.1 DUF397 domain-containing protein [Streptomyces noursei]GCB93171.1 DUF397 domain-containing protein [Streptomyces noursei]
MMPQSTGVFRKSSYSTQEGNCVEVAPISTGGHAIRDSKNPAGPHLAFPADAWSAFTDALKGDDRN